MPARRLRLPARARLQLPAGPRRHLRLALADPPLRPAHRRHRRAARSARPRTRERYFALLKVEQDQRRAARGRARQDPLRQPDAALPATEVQPRARAQELLHAHHRHALPDRQGPALPHRLAAARRQDGAAAGHRQRDHRQPPRDRPHRAAHRRAARRGHRHAAHGEGRGRSARPSTSRPRATSRSPRW